MHSHVVSPFCNCVCDNVSVEVIDGKLRPSGPVCPETAAAYAAINSAPTTAAWHAGVPCSFNQAICASSEMLAGSRAPLLFGMTGMGTNSQRAAIKLAESLGAIIDPASTKVARAALQALQLVGLSTCTLGEIKERADLIVFWGVDPVVSHPGLIDRLQISLPKRKMIVIDSQQTATSRIAQSFFHVGAEHHLPLIQTLRLALRGQGASASLLPESSRDKVNQLAMALKSCRYGVICFGEGIAQSESPELTLEFLFRLVEELNAFTRFMARGLGRPGAENVLSWQTGHASAVDFADGAPRPLTGLHSTDQRLLRDEVDCALILGSRSLSVLSKAAIRKLESLPTILIEPSGFPVDFRPKVQFATAVDGVHTRDTVYRCDDVALPMRPLVKSPFPTVAEVLQRLDPVAVSR